MSPSEVARKARKRGLDVIAICDHNSAENVEAVRRAAGRFALAVIGGMEITSREEVHVLGLFDDGNLLNDAQEIVYENLPGDNDPEAFGEQLVMDEQDRLVGSNSRLLIGATDLTLDDVVRTVHGLGGIAIASHVDRPSFSVISQLGFIPENLGLDAVEICTDQPPPLPEEMPVVRSSDAHYPDQIGVRRTCFLLEDATASEIGMALRQTEGRRILTEQ